MNAVMHSSTLRNSMVYVTEIVVCDVTYSLTYVTYENMSHHIQLFILPRESFQRSLGRVPLHFREFKIASHFFWHLKNSRISWTLEVRKEIADIILFGPKDYPNLCEECSMFACDRETPPLEDCLSLFYMTIHQVSLSQDIIIVFHDYGGREVPCR